MQKDVSSNPTKINDVFHTISQQNGSTFQKCYFYTEGQKKSLKWMDFRKRDSLSIVSLKL